MFGAFGRTDPLRRRAALATIHRRYGVFMPPGLGRIPLGIQNRFSPPISPQFSPPNVLLPQRTPEDQLLPPGPPTFRPVLPSYAPIPGGPNIINPRRQVL